VPGVSRSAVFLDRDGTLNVRPREHCYVTAVDEFEWIEGAPEAAAALSHAGYMLAVVSNQRGIARGLVTADVLVQLEARMQADLAYLGCRIDAFRYCPHEAEAGCACRKPAAGLLLKLAEELGLDLSRSWMVGDEPGDILAGRSAGCRTLLIAEALPDDCRPDLVARSLIEGARFLVQAREAA
jgi:D-glycero-D-manno-heptose 1,7-bisphosphate phosphatase